MGGKSDVGEVLVKGLVNQMIVQSVRLSGHVELDIISIAMNEWALDSNTLTPTVFRLLLFSVVG